MSDPCFMLPSWNMQKEAAPRTTEDRQLVGGLFQQFGATFNLTKELAERYAERLSDRSQLHCGWRSFA